MIDYIFIILLIIYLFLVLAFWKKEYVIGAISSMGLILSGLYLVIYGAGDVSNMLTLSIGIVNVALGIYILLRGTIEETQRYM